jgi:MoaA/NifB/PqqE/SkfB family radical SAM enzyme
LAKKYPDIGVRVSIEGLSEVNDQLRGRKGGFDRGIPTLTELHRLGLKDIGFGQTLSDQNAHDLVPLYEPARWMKMEFATAVLHNSFYFHKSDNDIVDKEKVIDNLLKLIQRQLEENSSKSWFRAYFNLGLINYIKGNKRMLACEAGSVNFFINKNPHDSRNLLSNIDNSVTI